MTSSTPVTVGLMTLTAAALVLLNVLAPNSAWADGHGDGAYGRFEHGVVLSIGAGVDVPLQGEPRPAVSGELRARIFNAAGPYLTLRGANQRTTLAVAGIELRPLFPALFLLDMSSGYAWVDLFVQSLSVELGVAWFPTEERTGLAVGIGFELPLLLPDEGVFNGIGLRLSARHVYAPGEIQGAAFSANQSEWSLLASLNLHLGLPLSAPYAAPSEYRAR